MPSVGGRKTAQPLYDRMDGGFFGCFKGKDCEVSNPKPNPQQSQTATKTITEDLFTLNVTQANTKYVTTILGPKHVRSRKTTDELKQIILNKLLTTSFYQNDVQLINDILNHGTTSTARKYKQDKTQAVAKINNTNAFYYVSIAYDIENKEAYFNKVIDLFVSKRQEILDRDSLKKNWSKYYYAIC